jgi:hypothetical protein
MQLNKLLLSMLFAIVLLLCTGIAGATTTGFSIKVLSENEDGIIFETSINNYEINPSPLGSYKFVNIKGCGIISQEGAPGVANSGQLIEIPEGCTLEIFTEPVEQTILGGFLLAPVAQKIVIEDEEGNKTIDYRYAIDTALYASNEYFPRSLVKVDYTGYLRDKSVARLLLYPIQYNPTTKKLLIHTRLRVQIIFRRTTVSESNALRQYDLNTNTGDSKNVYNNIYSSCLLNQTLSNYSATKLLLPEESPSYTDRSIQTEYSPFTVKITVEKEGIYKITYEDLNTLGVNLSATTNDNLKVENQGKEIAVYRSGNGSFQPKDYILFYGLPLKSLYSKKNIYWLSQGSNAGKKMAVKDGSGFNSSQTKATFKNKYRGEEDKKYWQTIPNGEGADHWFWESLTPTETSSASANLIAPLSNFSSNGEKFSIKVNLRGKTTPSHHTKVYINGQAVADFTWNGQIELTKDIPDISPSLFLNGNNTVRIEEILDSGIPVDTIFVNWFELSFIDTYVAENNTLLFNGEGNGSISYEIINFTTDNIWTFDVTDQLNVSQVVNTKIDSAGSAFSVKFGDSITGTKTYYAIADVEIKKPSGLTVDEPSNLNAQKTDIDYIIICHEDFYNAIQPLKDYRESRGLRVETVKIQDIYDEFSYGIKDAYAINKFLVHAYNNWHGGTEHPTYVLLVGDASIDFRDDLGYFTSHGRIDFVPTALFQTATLGDTPTDNRFVCVSGTDPLPDMIIGRLCVKTIEDVNNIIEKIQDYEGAPSGSWSKNVIFASDNGGVFVETSDRLASMIPENYNAEKVYLSDYSKVEDATNDLINKIDSGSLLTNYTGHGSVDNWAGEFLFHTPDDKDQVPRNDVERLNNGDKLTFVITLNCLNGFFPNFVDDYSLAEEFVRAKNKGAIACLAPTGLGYTSEHEVLAEEAFNRLFKDGDSIIGSLCYTAKINAYNKINSEDIIETFTLFGDPATELKIPGNTNNSSIKLLSPADGLILKRSMLYTFTWEDTQGSSAKYKVQFSSDTTFPDNKTIIAPVYGAKFITGTEYTPKVFIWMILNLMSINNEYLYWRVVGYDDNNQQVEYSAYRSFTITR